MSIMIERRPYRSKSNGSFRRFRSLYPMVLVGMVVASLPADAGRVSGKVEFEDRTFDLSGYTGIQVKPVRYCRVRLFNENLTKEFGGGATDASGEYAFDVPNSATETVRLVVSSDCISPWGELKVRNTFSKSIHSLATGNTTADTGGDVDIDMMIPVVWETQRIGDPYNVVDVLLDAQKAAYDALGEAVAPCTVYWADGSSDGTYYTGDALFLVGGTKNAPQSGDNDGYDDAVILHEYGHFLADKYSYDNTPGGDHSLLGYHSSTLTWSEGWANFYSSAARNSGVYWDATSGDFGFSVDFETGSPNAVRRIGMNNESAVAMVLFDIFDSGPEGDNDPVELGLGPIWSVFSGYMKNVNLSATLLDFYEGFQNLLPEVDTGAVFVERQIEFVPSAPHVRMFLSYPLDTTVPIESVNPVEESLDVAFSSSHIIKTVQVFVAVDHDQPSQLTVSLLHPDGTEIVLCREPDKRTTDLIEWFGYQNYMAPVDPLILLSGKEAGGTWKLKVDNASLYRNASIKAWGLRIEMQTGSFLMVY